MKKFGFTLFETLLTLSIVGIISALTVPTLVNNHQKQIYTTSLHKFYNDLDRAIQTYMADQHIDDLSESDLAGNEDGLREFVNDNFKIQKNCGTKLYQNENNFCFARYYRKINNNNNIDMSSLSCSVVFSMQSGTSVCMNTQNWGLTADVDTNGPNGPNIIGRDLIQGISVNSDGKIEPINTNDDGYYFDQILKNNWKMNY